MTIWAALVSLALGLGVILTMQPEAGDVVRSLLQLAAIIAVFAAICAREARER